MSLKKSIFFAVLALALIFIDQINLFENKFNFIILLLYYIGLHFTPGTGLLWSGGIGLAMDSISMKLFGPNILANGLVVFATYLIRSGIFNMAPLLNGILCFLFTLASGLIVYLSLALFDPHTAADFTGTLNAIMYQAGVNSIVGYFIIKEDE